MIELFDLIKEQRAKSIKIKCNHVSYWRSESEKINVLIEYINNNLDKFCFDLFEIEYDTIMDERYVKSFDIVLYTDKETYNNLFRDYEFLLEKYDKYTINLNDIKFYSLSANRDADGDRLH